MRALTRVVAAAVLAAAAYAGVPAAPASATPCGSAEGVTVVVDFHELGGGVQSACVRDGGDRFAGDLFPAAGFPLAYVQRQPDFVCRVKGLPTPEQDACVSTPPATAYWSLWWSDGRGWKYSTSNAGGLRVPDGGYVAFSWNTGSSPIPPGIAPAAHPAPTPTPATSPTAKATPTPASTPAVSAAPTPTPSASPTRTKKPKPKPKPTPSASASEPASPTEATEATESTAAPAATETVAPTSAEPASDGGGMPGWVAPAVIAVLFAGAGVVAVVRRRRTTSGS